MVTSASMFSHMGFKVLASGTLSPWRSATTHWSPVSNRLTCISFPEGLPTPSFADFVNGDDRAAQKVSRNGRRCGMRPATNESPPVSADSFFWLTTGFLAMSRHCSSNFALLSDGMDTTTSDLSSSKVMVAPIHLILLPPMALDSFSGKPATAAQRRAHVTCDAACWKVPFATMAGSSTYIWKQHSWMMDAHERPSHEA